MSRFTPAPARSRDAISPGCLPLADRRRCSPIPPGRSRCPPVLSAAGGRRSRRGFWKSGPRAVRHAARARSDERRQPLSRLGTGARGADARDRSVDQDPSQQNRARLSGAKEDTRKAPRRVPARDAGRDRHHAQHQRVEQPGLERPRSQGGRRGPDLRGQPSQQQPGVAGKSEALRIHRDRRRRRRTRTRAPSTTSTLSPRRSRRGRKVLAFTHLTSTVGDLFPGEGAVPAGARARRAVARRRRTDASGCSTSTSRDIQPDFYSGQRAQMALRRARMRRALRQRPRARPHLALVLQCLSRGRRHLAEDGSFGQRDEATMIAFRARHSRFRPRSGARRSSSARARWRSS